MERRIYPSVLNLLDDLSAHIKSVKFNPTEQKAAHQIQTNILQNIQYFKIEYRNKNKNLQVSVLFDQFSLLKKVYDVSQSLNDDFIFKYNELKRTLASAKEKLEREELTNNDNLYEEIQSLKEENKRLRSEIDDIMNQMNDMKDMIDYLVRRTN